MSSASQGMNIDTSQLPSTGIKMAIAVMGILPILVVYPFLQKYLVQGITIGADEGLRKEGKMTMKGFLTYKREKK